MENKVIEGLGKTIDKLRREVELLTGYEDLSKELARKLEMTEKQLRVKNNVCRIEGYFERDLYKGIKEPTNIYVLQIDKIEDTREGMYIRVIMPS